MRLIHQVGSLGTANIIYLLCQFGILSLLARLTTPETVSAFGFVMGVVQPLFMLLRMGLRSNLATDAKREFSFETFLTIRVIASLLLFVLPVMIIWTVRPEYLVLAVPIALMNAAESHSDLCYGALQRAGRPQIVARSMLIRGPAALLLFGTILYVTRDAQIAFWAQTVVWILVQVFHDFPGVRQAGETLALDRDFRRIAALTRNTSLLGLGQFFASLQTNVPRFFVETILGTVAMSLFTTVSALQPAAVSLFITLEQALGWRLSQIWVEGRSSAFYAMLRKMLCIAIGVAGLGICLSFVIAKPLLLLAFGPDYVAASPLLIWFAVAIGIQLVSSVLQTAITAQRRFSSLGGVQLGALCLTVPSTYIGVMAYGLEGAGMAIALVMLLRTLFFAVVLKRG